MEGSAESLIEKLKEQEIHPEPAGSSSSLLSSAVIVSFILWSAAFIYGSSVPLFNGDRSFCLFDDAMISMRYAENLANGNGPVWNPGETIEGYTSPLMVIVMAMFLIVFSKPVAVLFVQILGAACVLFTSFVSVHIYKQIAGKQNRIPSWLVLIFALSVYTLSYWSLMGMETGFVALFLAIGVATAIRIEKNCKQINSATIALLALSGTGLYLSRPDALSFAIIILILPAIRAPRREILKPLLLTLLIIASVVATHISFRFSYYGNALPNTAILKLGQFPLQYRISGGIGYILPFLSKIWPLAVLAILGTVFRKSYIGFLILALMTTSILYQIYVGGDPWVYWRIMSPTIPLIVILAADGAFCLMKRLFGSSARRLTVLLPATCVIFIALAHYNLPFLEEFTLLNTPYTTDSNIHNVNTAFAIRDLTKESASVGVFWAGSIPFYSERYAIDFLGKSDPTIAGRVPDLSGIVSWNGMLSVPGHNKYDLSSSIIHTQPTYIQGTRWGSDDVTQWANQHYVSVFHRGIRMLLLKNSPDVLWEKLEQIQRQN